MLPYIYCSLKLIYNVYNVFISYVKYHLNLYIPRLSEGINIGDAGNQQIADVFCK
jgi:hypothetical protein